MKALTGFKPMEQEAQNLREDVEWMKETVPGFAPKIDLPLLDTEDTTANGIPLIN
jgi:hypothetical protein